MTRIERKGIELLDRLVGRAAIYQPLGAAAIVVAFWLLLAFFVSTLAIAPMVVRMLHTPQDATESSFAWTVVLLNVFCTVIVLQGGMVYRDVRAWQRTVRPQD